MLAKRSLYLAPVLLALMLATSAPGEAATPGPPGGLDGRAYELVTPAETNGGEAGAPGSAAAGVLQASASGEGLAYGSAASFGAAAGSLPVNQYRATRTAGGWVSENLTPPALSGTYSGGAYLAFSADLASGLLANGWICRDGSPTCPAEGPQLSAAAPPGYRNLFLGQGGAFTPLLTATGPPDLPSDPASFALAFEGAEGALGHVAFSSAGSLYLWGPTGVEQIAAPPGAALAAPRGALSADGARIYMDVGGDLYLAEAGASRLVAADAAFGAASPDGSQAIYLAAGHLYRYEAAAEFSTDITPLGGVVTLLAASPDAEVLYYLAADGIHRSEHGTDSPLLSASPAALPPAAGLATAAAGGGRLYFDTPLALLGADTNAAPDVYEWEAAGLGSCAKPAGCLGLISDGRTGGARLAASSASGNDVFFATDTPLLAADHGSLDLYDARVGGGFPEPEPPSCLGDDCHGPDGAPDYTSPPTSLPALRSNPPPRFPSRCKKRAKQRRQRGASARRCTRHGGRR